MTHASDIIYVVHGSNAHTWWRRLANRGYPWWRRWSLFCCAVRTGFTGGCEIREFRWSGKNTHHARMEAGVALARLIEKVEKGRRVHIIGHSHGGNVALSAVNQLPRGRVESVIALANPNIALLDSRGQPPQWLYWGDAPERVARIWNLYSPEDFVQCRVAEWFHGITDKGRKIVLARPRYQSTGDHPVLNAEIRWQRRLPAHRSMHSERMGLCVGALLRGQTIPEAMEFAGLSATDKNDAQDRGGWPGVARTFEVLQRVADPSPFDLGNGAGRVGVLFVHGFTASPSEMRPMAQAVSQSRGWRCRAVLLPGHGTRVGDMQGAGGDDWLTAVDREYDALTRECDHVFLVGLSRGAALCCLVAVRRTQDPKLRGMLLMAPAFGVTRLRAAGIHLLRPIHNLANKGRRASDYFLDHHLYSYLQLPLNLAAHVIRLGAKAAANMGKLRNLPVIMFTGDRESTVSPAKILSVARDNPWIRLVRLSRSRHILTVEPDKEMMFEASIRFMEECLEKSS